MAQLSETQEFSLKLAASKQSLVRTLRKCFDVQLSVILLEVSLSQPNEQTGEVESSIALSI